MNVAVKTLEAEADAEICEMIKQVADQRASFADAPYWIGQRERASTYDPESCLQQLLKAGEQSQQITFQNERQAVARIRTQYENGLRNPHESEAAPKPEPAPESLPRSIFGAHAPDLIALGYSVLPRIIDGGHGRPGVKKWSDYCDRQPDQAQIEKWSRIKGADLSLACGFGGLIAIDVDTDEPELLAAVRRTLPQCDAARFGSKGFALLTRHADGPQRTQNIWSANESRRSALVEIMGIGRSIAIPPSIHHKTGKPYLWIDPATSERRPADRQLPALADLPEITKDDIEALKAALAPWSRKPKPPRPTADGPAPVLNSASEKRYRAYALAGLEKAKAELAGLKEGRPSELFRAVCGLGWAVTHSVLGQAEFVNAFAAACEQNGLAARDGRRAIEATIQSGLRHAEHDPMPVLKDMPLEKLGTASASKLNGAHAAKNEGRAARTATFATNASDKAELSQKSQGGRPLFQEEPLPLYRELPRSEAFPVEALGSTLGGMAKALHEAAVQSPMAICGTAVLAAAACATQALRNVELPIPNGKSKPLSLYFLTIAQSGERKTATDAQALRPIHERAAELQQEYDSEILQHKNELDVWNTERAKILKDRTLKKAGKSSALNELGAAPRSPRTPILTLQEPTLEGLTKHLKIGYPAIGLFSSEGGQFIGGHAMSDDSKKRSAAALNALWDDGRLERIRATEEATILPGRRLSVFLQAQPDVAQYFLTDPVLRDMGLLARFLFTQPDSTMGFRRFRELEPHHQRAITAYGVQTLRLLRCELPYDDRMDGLEPRPLLMEGHTRTAWIKFADYVEGMLAPGNALHEIAGFANKLPEHAARIAAVLQVYDDPDAVELAPDYLKHGIEIAQFYASEAVRLHSTSRVAVDLKEAERLRLWIMERWAEPYVTVRAIQRGGPGSIREKDRIEHLLAILESHHWVALASYVAVEGKMVRTAWAVRGRVQ